MHWSNINPTKPCFDMNGVETSDSMGIHPATSFFFFPTTSFEMMGSVLLFELYHYLWSLTSPQIISGVGDLAQTGNQRYDGLTNCHFLLSPPNHVELWNRSSSILKLDRTAHKSMYSSQFQTFGIDIVWVSFKFSVLNPPAHSWTS